MEPYEFETWAVSSCSSKPDNYRSIRFPVYTSAAFDFESSEAIRDVFEGKLKAHSYTRLSNPTVEALERKITTLEKGYTTIALSSGMAAVTNTLFSLMKSGDNLVASSYLFGNTYTLLKETLSDFGLETRYVDITSLDEVESAIDDKTRVLFLETISNPQNVVPDIAALSSIAKKHGIVLMVDATVVTPWLFNPDEFGVDVVIHSTTKFISGGATSIGGLIVDMGTFDWTRIPVLRNYHHLKKDAFIARLKKEIFRNFGSCMAPQTAFLQNLGLETLSLRVDKACENAMTVARMLNQHEKVVAVHYPGLTDSVYHELATKQFKGRYGAIIGFELENQKVCFEFMNKLKLIHRATNLNDNQSLIIHPASTIFCNLGSEEKESLKVTDGLIRFSVGIEHVNDIMADLNQALD